MTNSRAGTVQTRRRARLSPEVGGQVVEIPFREGDSVEAGAVLLRLDDAAQTARLELSRRDVAAARAERQRGLCHRRARRTRAGAQPRAGRRRAAVDRHARSGRERAAGGRRRLLRRSCRRGARRCRGPRRPDRRRQDDAARPIRGDRGGGFDRSRRVDHPLPARDAGAAGDRRPRPVGALHQRADGRGRFAQYPGRAAGPRDGRLVSRPHLRRHGDPGRPLRARTCRSRTAPSRSRSSSRPTPRPRRSSPAPRPTSR